MKLNLLVFFALYFFISCNYLSDSMSKYNSDEILKNLDDNRGIYYSSFLVMNHGYTLPIDVRMHLYGDDDRWAIVIEKIEYHNRDIRAEVDLIFFGNCLFNLVESNGEPYNRNSFIICEESELVKLTPNIDDYFELISPLSNEFKIKVRDSLLDVEYNKEVYKEYGIEFNALLNENNEIDYISLLRLLNIKNKDLFKATDEELRTSIPSDLPKIMTIDEWFHEDMTKPSTLKSYQMAAKVLETKDTSFWDKTQPVNTHWKNWPDAGDL